MTHYYNANHTAKASALHRALLLVICFILSSASTSFAQTIGGNVYGAGNQGDVGKSSTVTLKGGTIMGDVYGGARMANVGEYSFVNIDGENATSSLIVKSVYGGNDIAGIIGNSTNGWTLPDDIKTKFPQEIVGNTFIYSSTNTHYPVIIGSLYGGGNGDYTYTAQDRKFNVAVGSETFEVENKPELNNTHIKLLGGIYGHIYGGGNKATITYKTTIHWENGLTIEENTLNRIPKENARFLGLSKDVDYIEDGDNMVFTHHVSRMFGGNNLATMSIRPTWNLIKGSINNLYSGGNRGAMTNEDGILLPLTSADLTVNNVYGGCRIADVNPGKSPIAETFNDYSFPAGYATRVYITAGNINNVYGGNDISGKVHFGTNLAIFSNIKGDVYGGGNGSYAYTDKITTSDYYYVPGTSSIESLFNFRPHIEKTLIHVAGKDAEKITLGSVYCGGNSATLYKADGDAAATFHIGKNVTINNVFLGSNGANMVSNAMLTQYADANYNTIDLTDTDQFASYMDAVAVYIFPKIEWEADLNHTTKIGSFFCGGNIGSMKYAGVAKTGNNNFFEFPAGITITEKIVAGCNNANIPSVDNLNAAYEGGLTGTYESETNDKVRIKVLSCLEPSLSANAVKYQDAEGTINESKIYQGANVYGGCYQSGVVNGNVVIDVESDIIAPDLNESYLTSTGDYIDASALAIYGGGYGENAVIEGNTTINLTEEARVLLVFGGGEMGEVTGNTTVKLAQGLKTKDGDNNYQNAYKVYAGGYAGPVGGNTTLNLLGGSVMSAFAGACNANIGGTTEAIIGAGTPGVPYVTHAVYGGNDFGGTIGGTNAISKLYNVEISDDIVKNVRTQTYVKYVSGKIGRAIYGGSYGSYAYTNAIYGDLNGHTYPTIKEDITRQQNDPAETILTNTFVDIASTSNSPEDVIGSDNSDETLTMLAGGGRGYKGLPEKVEVGQTYLLLHGESYANRNNQLMAHRVYGGGNLSKVGKTRIDAYSGSFGAIFGGTHGVKTETANDLDASYDCGDTKINFYAGMDKADMNLFGTGANSGATGTATINLHGGKVNNVYGGSLAEGYTANTVVNVPETSSNLQANALFGGALGESEGRPCDVGVSNVTFASTTATATVEDGIYGGNHTARATKETNVAISVPVMNQHGNLLSIYGAGYGAGTVAGSTHVTLNAGAEVANVYGGGREGKVYNVYNHYDTSDAFAKYSNNGRHAKWEISKYAQNTLVEINGTSEKIARVTGNVYGAGLGEDANTCGKTKVRLLGGTVDGDIYGGGFAGTMLSLDNTEDYDENIGTLCDIQGGQVRNVFGGGYQGKIEGNSGVSIGSTTPSTDTPFFGGVPTILRSAYGGGEMAEVTGTSTVDMYNGYIGYRYYPGAEENNKYQPELKLNADDEANLLSENGNLYGAGFGEGAVVMKTQVRLYGGTIRNGLYGGGEIASVGSKIQNNDGSYTYTYGQTNVYMYGGLVVGDVFGGGRGYSYDLTGNQIVGKTLYIDGYVFGKTNVEIYRGTIGTDESLALGHGNVFGGGNIGYVYSRGVKSNGDNGQIKGHYYHTADDPFTTDKTETTAYRTEDCRVHIAAGALVTADASVTINNHTYSKGELVPNADLNTLAHNATEWASLDNEGVTIRNAVFAGGNVSAGSDKVYANAVTVFGNATAAVVDVFSRDLVTLGGEHVGGLYGDGNLTFVDGYRELNITNYGTDYYRLEKELTNDQYNTKYNKGSSLTPELEREKAYYMYDAAKVKWVINTTSGRMMNTIQRADFCGVFGSRFLLHGAQDRVPDVVDYTNYTINRVGEVSLNTKTVGNTTHGNYFGIYNVVNELGALTSNVEFNNATDYPHQYITYTKDNNGNVITSTGKSYLDYKIENFSDGPKNMAISPNMVALASGVYLELLYTNPETQQKEYGPITGVIELDLLNVQPGEGGGYVYAKNEHGSPNTVNSNAKKQLTLSTANAGAITQKAFTYAADNANPIAYQTSGNFVHATNTIIDNCFNDDVHYWYISGTIYVYDQKISAYTGAVDTRQQSLNIPLSINTANSEDIQIFEIHPNKYFVGTEDITSFTYGNKVYKLNDPISYWDWKQLPPGRGYEEYFADMTYIAQEEIWETDDLTQFSSYNKGDVIASTIYESEDFPQNFYINKNGVATLINKDEVFRITNEMSHDNGYMLTFEMTNPSDWGTYYTNSENTVLGSTLQSTSGYEKAPTIKCNQSGVYGQKSYDVENLINEIDYNKQQGIIEHIENNGIQATFEPAYYVKESMLVDDIHYNVGSYIPESKLSDNLKQRFGQAYICTSTIEVAEKEFILNGEWISAERYESLTGFQYAFSRAYVCTKAGLYGGVYYKQNENLTAEEFCDLPKEERNMTTTVDGNTISVFEFNKDALDLFATENHERYNRILPVSATPKQTATLYVPRESNIENLSKDRIITVILKYKVGEQTPENHVVNIHVEFKTGQPTIGNIIAPPTVLPNTIVGLTTPSVTRGAYEIIGGGWEIYKTEADARAHKNGEPYINNTTPMYWYQDGYHVAYYAKTYLGKTYSNPVRFSIANYHRLGEVMNHKVLNENGDEVNQYMFIDHEEVKRAPKIYLDAAEYPNASIAAGKGEKNDLDYFAELYNATLDANKLEGRVKGCANLEFILRSDIAPKTYSTWTSVGSQTTPFAGTFHGNGYTISGLNGASLFGYLGGKVYNLGVNGGNIANNLTNGGHIENVWVSTTTPTELSVTNVVNYHFLTDAKAASFAKGEVAYKLNSFYAPNVQYDANGYVEKYFADGDFIYAGGTIPLTTDIRYQNGQYKPLADDYIFFGQRLIYDAGHESLPNRINKVGNAIDRTANSDRVYRTSAYYMNSTESDIFFNTDAKFVDTYDSKPIHHNLTAIDFTGSKKDMEQLLGFSLDGLTRNLLVYAENVANNPTYGNIGSYLNETALSISTDGYKTVAKNTSPARGHLVTKQIDGSYVALTDHFLVDKENFNVPIEYSFDSDKRMWYQREPDRFAVAGNGNSDGWDIICLPFTAKLVTTHQKGEITHFYQGSTTNHEYWLREFEKVSTTTTSDDQTSTTAAFASLAPGSTPYTATSTFLYDTYYKDKNDANADSYPYQQSHYAKAREYENYAYLQANTPYIIAFPGQSYHEFDMSGNFVPEHTATSIGKLDKQVVTFVSKEGATIGVTDNADLVEPDNDDYNGYNFVGTYQKETINNGYLINAEGSAFVKSDAQGSQPIAQSSIPFRGYLTTPTRGGARKIFIGAAAEEDEVQDDVDNRGITVYGRRGGIYIESTLEEEKTLLIYNVGGQIIKKVTVLPMSKIFVPISSRGIYIVNRQKVSVL